MVYDYSFLEGKITEKCGSQKIFAKEMGKSERTISLKLNNKLNWTQPEIEKASCILEENNIQKLFFTTKVQAN